MAVIRLNRRFINRIYNTHLKRLFWIIFLIGFVKICITKPKDLAVLTNRERCMDKIDGEAPDKAILDALKSRSGSSATGTGTMRNLWTVVTTIAPPTSDIKYIAARTNRHHRLVIVADKNTASDWHYPNCTLLPFHNQTKLGFDMVNEMPVNSLSRKALGYLYAIQNGAEYIYDTDDDTLPYDDPQYLKYFQFHSTPGPRLVAEKSDQAKSFPGATFFNPCAHFGQPQMWPRGHPIEQIRNTSQNIQLRLYDSVKPAAIQQGMIDDDPDVDAIFRLTNYRQVVGRLFFDPTAPAVNLGEGVYAPTNSQNTLFKFEAFWALVLPASVTFRVTDIWRGFWAARLLWEIGETVTYYPPNARQIRNAHNYHKDFMQEQQLYDETGRLGMALDEWKCRNETFRQCILDLTTFMAERKFWSFDDVKLIDAWLNDLAKIGYRFPKLKRRPTMKQKWDVGFVSSQPTISQHRRQQRLKAVSAINNYCQPFGGGTPSPAASDLRGLERMALVVVFNKPFLENIRMLRVLYEPWFAQVIFCGTFSRNYFDKRSSSTNKPEFENYFRATGGGDKFSYIHVSKDELERGHSGVGFHHFCSVRAMSLGIINIDGYLVIGDDTLLNFWTPFNSQNLHSSINWCNYPAIAGSGYWIDNDHMLPSTRKITDSLKKKANAKLNTLPSEVKRRMLTVLPAEMLCVVDIYYVPYQASSAFVDLAKIYLDHGTIAGIAVPQILSVLGWRTPFTRRQHRQTCVDDFRGIYVWGEDRKNVLSYYDYRDHFLHSFKFSLLQETEWKQNFCKTYLSAWLDATSAF